MIYTFYPKNVRTFLERRWNGLHCWNGARHHVDVFVLDSVFPTFYLTRIRSTSTLPWHQEVPHPFEVVLTPDTWTNVENDQGYNLPLKYTTFFSFLLSPLVKQPMIVLYVLKGKCLSIDLGLKQKLFLKVSTFHAKAQYIYLKDPTFSDI